jgi:hypothetical protein
VLASGAFWWVTTSATAILIAVFVLHRHFRSHHLRTRIRFDLLPTAGFDPSLQAVLAFAHQLGRVRPVRGWVPKSVVGVRIRFSTNAEFGKMVMSVEGRESVTGVLNKLVYPDVEIRRSGSQTSSVDGGEKSPRRRRISRCDLSAVIGCHITTSSRRRPSCAARVCGPAQGRRAVAALRHRR